jgi:hypothetical protein
MRLKCSEAGQLAFDFTVMRAHDIYVDTMFRLAMSSCSEGDDLGIARVIATLKMILHEVG